MIVVYPRPAHYGWSSVTVMAHLLAESFEARLIVTDGERRATRREAVMRRVPTPRLRDDALIVASLPSHLSIALSPAFRRLMPRRVFAWVIDSFRDDEIPDVARSLGFFDALFVGDAEAVPVWEKVTGTAIHWLPFGTPAMEIAARARERQKTVDVQRIGRQPSGWDDEILADAASEARVTFSQSVPSNDDHLANQFGLHDAMLAAKTVLAFSNVAAPAGYTHSTYQYVTARWLDSLAAGAIVAGTPPRCAAADRLLWPEGLVSFWPTTAVNAMSEVARALEGWTPEIAERNRGESLRRNDWRWRFAEISRVTGVQTSTLSNQLDRLKRLGARAAPLSE